MAALGLRRLGLAAYVRSPIQSAAPATEGRNLGQALDDKAAREVEDVPTKAFGDPQQKLPLQYHLQKAYKLHIGADVYMPTTSSKATPVEAPEEKASIRDPFDGLPLKAWAERLGERVMPAYEVIKEEQRQAKLAAVAAKSALKSAASAVQDLPVPSVPHFLPFTRWAAQNKTIQSTFIAKDAKQRPKARLSWYHPDDTMVPRDWFRGGLLADLKYYKPFGEASS